MPQGTGAAIESPQAFAVNASAGPVRCRISISQIPTVVDALNRMLTGAGVPSPAIADVHKLSLLSVCPACGDWCSGAALARMPMYASAGADHVSFVGNSGGFERMLAGQCLNYSCCCNEHELFWCPDLSSADLANLRERRIIIDPEVNVQRGKVWQPVQDPSKRRLTEHSQTSQKPIITVSETILDKPGQAFVLLEGTTDKTRHRVSLSEKIPDGLDFYAPHTLLEILAHHEDFDVRWMVAWSQCTPPAILEMLSKEDNLRGAIISNPNTPIRVLIDFIPDGMKSRKLSNLNKLMDNQDLWAEKMQRHASSESHNRLPETLRDLANDEDRLIRLAVAWNPNTPPDALIILTEDEYVWVRSTAISHPNTPLSKLEELVVAKSPHLGAVADNPNVSGALLEAIGAIAQGRLYKKDRVAVAWNPKTPLATLMALLQDEDELVRWVAARNPAAPADALASAKKNRSVRKAQETDPGRSPSAKGGVLQTAARWLRGVLRTS